MAALAALLFDLDGTLIDSAQGIAAVLNGMARERGGGEISTERVRWLVSRGIETVVSEGLGRSYRNAASDVPEFRARLAELPADPTMVYPGVVAALEVLTEAGHVMAVVTNKPERLSKLLLEQLELGQFFRAVIGGDTLDRCKPDPAPLHHARHAIEAGPETMMIGDSELDAQAAEAAGCRFLLYSGGYGAVECDEVPRDHRFGNFDALPELVGRFCRQAG